MKGILAKDLQWKLNTEKRKQLFLPSEESSPMKRFHLFIHLFMMKGMKVSSLNMNFIYKTLPKHTKMSNYNCHNDCKLLSRVALESSHSIRPISE